MNIHATDVQLRLTVLLRIYAKRIDGQDKIAKRRIAEAVDEDSSAEPAESDSGDDQADDGR